MELHSKSGLKRLEKGFLKRPVQFAQYTILFFPKGEGIYRTDFGTLPFAGPVLLFSTPLQVVSVEQSKPVEFIMLQFHSDFYCIEYHRVEVACNGLLFNNIYLDPSVNLSPSDVNIYHQLVNQLEEVLGQSQPSDYVLLAYLQLFLAKSSSIKINLQKKITGLIKRDDQMERFRQLLEEHFLTLHKPSDYAALLAMSSSNLSRRCSKYFRKNPSQLIQERLILEAKKQLHLTRLSIKEIAYALNFRDEFYFSRFFKNITHVSPQTFREKTGISIVADLSKE